MRYRKFQLVCKTSMSYTLTQPCPSVRIPTKH